MGPCHPHLASPAAPEQRAAHANLAKPGSRSRVRLILLAIALTLSACSAPKVARPPVAQPARLPVISTVLPITLLTRAVAGDCAEVRALVPATLSPHDFQAKPEDLLALRKARVLVSNGLGLETFLAPLIAAAGNRQLVVIDTSVGVRTLAGDNPHIWLDPLRAAQQVATIREGLVKADPACAEGYRRRAAAFTTQLQQLHTDLTRQLSPYRGKTFVAFHAVTPYFAERYGLKAIHLVDVPEMNPTPADLQRVTAAVKGTQLQALLREPRATEGAFDALARDLGVRISVFDPLETAGEPASRDPATYFRVMRQNGANLRAAFGG